VQQAPWTGEMKNGRKTTAGKNTGGDNLKFNLIEGSIREASVPKIAHELRARLSIIRGAVDNVIDGIFGEINEPQEKQLRLAVESADRLLALVEEMMAAFSDNEGSMRLNFMDVSLPALIGLAVDSMHSESFKEGVTLLAEVLDESLTVRCDPAKIEQVMINLFRNAIKFTSRGGSVTVRMKDLGDRVSVSVVDTGVGIPEEKLRKILNNPTNISEMRDANGGFRSSGLGLIIVKEIIEAHGGEISVESEIGKGTAFTFILNRH
jgi:two-component system, OmpR family, phosphate regulon sensor histidine kinase PhoR